MLIMREQFDRYVNKMFYGIFYYHSRNSKYKLFAGKLTGFYYTHCNMMLKFDEKEYDADNFKFVFSDRDEAEAYLEYLNGV